MFLTLSRRAQKAARRNLFRHAFFNACGFGLTSGDILALLVLAWGATDLQTGLIYAAPNVTAAAAVLAPLLLNGRETTSIWARFWWARAIVSFGYVFVILLAKPDWRVWAVVGIFYTWGILRAFGMCANFASRKALASARDLPAMTATTFARGQTGLLVVKTLSFAVLYGIIVEVPEVQGLLGLLFLGALSSLVSSAYLSRLPPTGYLEEGSLGGIWRALADVAGSGLFRATFALGVLAAGMQVCLGYLINFLKREVGLDSGLVLLFTLGATVGVIGASHLLRAIGSRVNPRVLLFSALMVVCLAALGWSFVQAVPFWRRAWFLALLFVPTGAGLGTCLNLVMRLKTENLPETRAVQTSVVYQVGSMVASLGALGLIALLQRTPASMPLAGTHEYSEIFLLQACLALVGALLCLRLPTGEGRPFFEDLSLLAPANLVTFYRLYRLEGQEEHPARGVALEGVMLSPSQASREVLLESLSSADLARRYAALRTLPHTPHREAFGSVLAEAESVESPLRPEAISALGFLGNRYAVEALRGFLAEPLDRVRAAALKSLLRLRAAPPEAEILRLHQGLRDPRARLDVAVGLTVTGRRDLFLILLGRELAERPGPSWSRPLLVIAADLWDRRADLAELYDEERGERDAGLAYILADRGPAAAPAELEDDALRGLFAEEAYAELAERLRAAGPDQPWLQAYDRTTALGVLFLWTLLREEQSPPPRRES